MDDQPKGLSGFAAELRRRHVFRTLLAYGAVTFVVLQAAEIVLPAFGVGDWFLQLVVVLSVLGLPVVLALAWVYEITPRGIRTTKALDLEAGRRLEEQGNLLPRLALLGVTLLATGAAGIYWIRTSVPDGAVGSGDPVAGPRSADPGAASPAFRAADEGAVDVPVRSLAVLPLESFASPSSGDDGAAEGAWFAAGMHEALISQLSRAGASFRVISRTTVQQYDPTGKSMAQIGGELGVEGIVEGSVTLDGGRVRITVQLIHAPSDTHLWSADYERELEDVIALQRDVATAIAGAITGELGEGSDDPGRVASADAPDADPGAAVAEMRGRVVLSDASDANTEQVAAAQRHFEEALRRDSAYAPAIVGLAGSTLMRELLSGTPSAATLRRVESQVDRALLLDPESPEARDIKIVVEGLENMEIVDVGDVAGPEGRGRPTPAPAAPEAPVPVSTELGARLWALSSRDAGATPGGVDRNEIKVGAARTLLAVGRLSDAARLLRDVLATDPGSEAAWGELERLVVLSGAWDEVAELRAERAEAVGSGDRVAGAPSVDALEAAVEREGARGYWRWRLEEIRARKEAGRDVSHVDEATALAALGRADAAFAALERAVEAGDPSVATLRGDPTWDPYRRDPRFQAAVSRTSARGHLRGG